MTKPEIDEITVEELQQLRQQQAHFFLLDVRQPNEHAAGHIDGYLIPLGELELRINELLSYKDQKVIVHCRSGGRSAQAVTLLKKAGFNHVFNLHGGLLAWAERIDPSIAVVSPVR